MKMSFVLTGFLALSLLSFRGSAQGNAGDLAQVKNSQPSDHKAVPENLYIDVHHFGAGKVNFDAVAGAHLKDLATEGKYGVHFLKFWVDEREGTVYCLSSSADSQSVRKTHAEAHGLLPDQIYQVTDGPQAASKGKNSYFLDVHEFGPGKVSAKDVAGAHQKDLAVEKKYGVNFINYWVNEKDGTVMCLSQAPDSSAVIKTHKEAHGLIPAYIEKVKQGE